MNTPELNDYEAVCKYVEETVAAGSWRMVVVPRQVLKEKNGVLTDDETQEAELYNTCVGKVISLGNLAFKANTKAHLALHEDSRKPKVGDWVVFHANASRRFELRAQGDEKIVFFILQDTDYLGRTEHPDRFLAYLS